MLNTIKPGQKVLSVPLSDVRPFYEQPREDFDQERLQDLADSMREHGQLAPCVVRRASGEKRKWELVDGERRFRAAQLNGAESLLVIVSEVSESDDQFVAAVIANSARADLSSVEVARAVARVAAMPAYRDLGPAQSAKLAAVFGRSRAWAISMLKVDSLEQATKDLVQSGALPLSGAVQLAAIAEPARQVEIAARVAKSGLSALGANRAIETALRVERVRKGEDVPIRGTHQAAKGSLGEMRMVAEIIGRIQQSAETLLDMPAQRLRDAFETRPDKADEAVVKLDDAAAALAQVRSALVKLAQRRAL